MATRTVVNIAQVGIMIRQPTSSKRWRYKTIFLSLLFFVLELQPLQVFSFTITPTHHNQRPRTRYATKLTSSSIINDKDKNDQQRNSLGCLKKLPFWTGLRFIYETFRGRVHYYFYELMTHYKAENFIIWNRYVTLNEPTAIRDVLETYNLPKSQENTQAFQRLFPGNGGILAAPLHQWKQQRRMTAKALSEQVIGSLIPRFQQGSLPFLDLLEHAALSDKEMEMDHIFQALTLDTIGLVLLGRSFGTCDGLLQQTKNNTCEKKKENQKELNFFQAFQIVSDEALRQMVLPAPIRKIRGLPKRVQYAKDVLESFLESCIQERLKSKIAVTTPDLLQILLSAESKGIIDREDVKAQLLTFLFAGHDTTAHTLSWLIYEVSINATLQQDLFEEVESVLVNRTDFPLDRRILKHQLPLMDQVWKETNRKHPAVASGTLRVVGDESIIVGDFGLELPARTSVSIPPYSVHRNPRLWPNPEIFDPSRFDPVQEAERNPMAFQSFSAGPKQCMGTQLAQTQAVCIAATIVRRFHIRSTETSLVPASVQSLTTKPRNGIHVKFERRID